MAGPFRSAVSCLGMCCGAWASPRHPQDRVCPMLAILSQPHTMVPQGPYAAGAGGSMVLLSRGEKLCPFKWDLTSAWLFGLPQAGGRDVENPQKAEALGLWKTMPLRLHNPTAWGMPYLLHPSVPPAPALHPAWPWTCSILAGPAAKGRTVLTALGCAAWQKSFNSKIVCLRSSYVVFGIAIKSVRLTLGGWKSTRSISELCEFFSILWFMSEFCSEPPHLFCSEY